MSMDWKDLKLAVIERACRQLYLDAAEAGVTHAEMSMLTGVAESMFSMWLSGYRPVVKVEQLAKLVEGASAVERLAQDPLR